MFLDYVREGRSTHGYTEGHAKYLEDAVKRASKHLAQAAPQPVAASAIHECRTQLDLLLVELSSIPSELGHPDRLSAASERMGRMRESLAGANSRL